MLRKGPPGSRIAWARQLLVVMLRSEVRRHSQPEMLRSEVPRRSEILLDACLSVLPFLVGMPPREPPQAARAKSSSTDWRVDAFCHNKLAEVHRPVQVLALLSPVPNRHKQWRPCQMLLKGGQKLILAQQKRWPCKTLPNGGRKFSFAQ